MSHLSPSTTSVIPPKNQLNTNSALRSTSAQLATFNQPVPRKRRRKRENPQACFADTKSTTEDCDSDDSYPMSSSDVESFQGKIVYNPDGSAYIIDSENDSFSNVSDNCLSVGTFSCNATNTIGGGTVTSSTSTNPNPKIHSFRVVTANDASVNFNSAPNAFKIQKPILMCFICKLSFGNTKSFSLHANSEHALNLQESEKQLLSREYSSAIIQRNVDEKPQISFLEPLNVDLVQDRQQHVATPMSTPTTATIVNIDLNIPTTKSAEVNATRNSNSINVTMSSNTSDEQPNNSSVMQQQQQHMLRVDLSTNSSAAAAAVIPGITATASLLSPVSSSSCTTLPTSINYCSLKTTAGAALTTKTTATNDTTAAAATTSMSVTTSSNNTINTRNTSSTDNLSSTHTVIHPTTPINTPTATPSPSATPTATTSCSSAPHSPQSSSTTIAGSCTVADYLQLQLQRITASSPAPAAAVTSCGSDTTTNTSTILQQQQLPPPPAPTTSQHNSLSSLHASLAALANDQSNSNNVKLINDFLQHQLAAQQQQQQQIFNLPHGCPDHPDIKGIDCKTCELVEIQLLKPTLRPQRSPTNMSCSLVANLTTSPTTSSSVSTTPTTAANMSTTPTSAAASASSFTIGACPEHINGRPLGMDCARCEMILNSARLNSGVQMSTRNSCKTLKCPQCNWHYKYQETLEIHMREKHPDGESACGYCLAGQQHPRLARGESYTCGYKPYRCEICNYSTTTKGNLSIHMQSDKHLNNMQELNTTQNIAAAAAAAASSQSDVPSKMLLSNNLAAASAAAQQQQQQQQQQQHQQQQNLQNAAVATASNNSNGANKPKPSFRCDVCSYETSVARNLRIHMTSEKHTHNMAVLQNNIKHIQAFSFMQHQQAVAAQQQQQQHQAAQQKLNPLSAAAVAAAAASGNLSQLQQLPGALGGNFLPEAALADLAYNQALMIQLLHQKSAAGALSAAAAAAATQQQHSTKNHMQVSPASPSGTASSSQPPPYSPSKSPSSLLCSADSSDLSLAGAAIAGGALSQDTLDPSIEPDTHPTTFYSCLVCATYNTDSLDELNQHLLIDRSRQNTASNSSEIMLILNNNYICRLCNYKTNLKANFQLHSKTDKHLQKLNFINHIREGGPRNEYKLKYHQISTNTVQLKCNCCDFYTNSIQKLSLHSQHMRHDTMKIIFQHLQFLMQKNASEQSRRKGSRDNAAETAELSAANLADELYNDGSSNKALLCQLCNFSALNLLHMVQHVKSLRHIQVEQLIGLQRRSEGLESLGLEDVFKISEYNVNALRNVDCIKSERSSPDHMSATNDASNAYNVSQVDSIATEQPASSLDNQFFGQASTDSKYTSNVIDMSATAASNSGLPAVIFKCNHCDYFSQLKQEIEQHHELLHPSSDLDYISIPTNAAAIQAFQTAVAAATAAAAVSATRGSKSPAPRNVPPNNNDCPVAIKKERLTELPDVDEDDEPSASSAHDNETTHMESDKEPFATSNQTALMSNSSQCPLCQDSFTEKHILEMHLMGVHSVSQDGLARLLQLVDQSSWHNMQTPTTPNCSNNSEMDADTARSLPTTCQSADVLRSNMPTTAVDANLQCHQCGLSFKLQQQLLMHAQETQHYAMINGEYQCLAMKQCAVTFPTPVAMLTHFKDTHMNLVISERHVYKYRCKQCSLAFKTQEKLAAHALYHTMRDATKCGLCQRNFRSTQSLQKHMDQVHPNNAATQTQPTSCVSPKISPSCSGISAALRPTDMASEKTDTATAAKDSAAHTLDHTQTGMHCNVDDVIKENIVDGIVAAAAASAMSVVVVDDDADGSEQFGSAETDAANSSFECHKRNGDLFTRMSYRHEVNKLEHSVAHYAQNESHTSTCSRDKRKPYKCNICRVCYAQGSTLDIHMRSVLHQTRVNKLLKEQQSPQEPPPIGTQPLFTTNISCHSSTDLAASADNTSSNTHPINLKSLPTTAHNTHVERSPAHSSQSLVESQEPKDTHASPLHSNTSPIPSSGSEHQQQHVAAIAALIKQQQQQQQQADSETCLSPDVLQQLQMEPASLAQKIMEQNMQQASAHFPSLSPQNLQSLQNLHSLQSLQQMQQHLPQMAVAAAASGISMNPVDMLNLMQFHHLMSLNFMNLAPPLIFGGGATGGTAASSAPITQSGSTAASSNVLSSATNSNVAGSVSATAASTSTNTSNESAQQQNTSSASTAANSQISNNQKRARTRITDDQLKILRAHFDINNSPSEESIMEMSKKANLPMKVVKHWFRNTLFKERQRNKDSPYNFNNPPSTTLNLEEYERTGQTKVTPVCEGNFTAAIGSNNAPAATTTPTTTQSRANAIQQQQVTTAYHQHVRPDSAQSSSTGDFLSNQANLNFPQLHNDPQRQNIERPSSRDSSAASGSCPLDVQIKSEPRDEPTSAECDPHQLNQQQLLTPTSAALLQQHQQLAAIAAAAAANESNELNEHSVMQAAAVAAAAAAASAHHHQQQQHLSYYNSYETKSESGSSDILSRPQTPNSSSATNPYSSMSDILGQQMDILPLNNMSNMNNMGPPKKFQMSKVFEKNSPSSQFETNSNSSNSSSTSSGKRANRTRFTDYQIKVLQEFFENNSYPKDSDLEYLSKLLLLSPRVIVVWFQNARQKQRKIYENQPNNSFYETDEKKQNINYVCKKCNLMFQRYYELVRHQKNHCFKEENNKKSAKAQIAAAQIAQSLSSEDSNSSMDINNVAAAGLLTGHHQQHVAAVAAAAALAASAATTPGLSSSPSLNLLNTSPQHLYSKAACMTDCSPSTTPTPPQRERSTSVDQVQQQKYDCEKCSLTFQRFEQLREHQLIHIMNPSLFGQQSQQTEQQKLPDSAVSTFSPYGGILQSLQQAASVAANRQQQHDNSMSHSHSQEEQHQLKKRKFSDASSNADEISGAASSTGEYELMQSNKKFKSDQYDFLYQYFLQNESNMELKLQFQTQQQQSQQPDMELDYLANFYQQTEMKKRNNYDFLFQYYIRNEQTQQQQQTPTYDATNKPNMDFLLQYYQLSESKKFFQLAASPQRIHDCNIATTPTIHNDRDVIMINSFCNSVPSNNCNNSNTSNGSSSSDSTTNNNDSKTMDRGNNSDEDDVTEDNDIAANVSDVTDDVVVNMHQLNTANIMPNTFHYNSSACNDNDMYTPAADADSNDNNKCNTQIDCLQFGSGVDQNQTNDTHELRKTTTIKARTPTEPMTTSPTITDEQAPPATSAASPCGGTNANCQQPLPLVQPNYNSLEDFLDATMIENHTQTLIFNDASDDSSVTPMKTAISASTNATTATTTTSSNISIISTGEHKQNKRLRTTILPEQLNFLYECYQNESNPSRKMLEEISKKVNLKKRVVQVWYQNSRARERKGQFRQNLQIINKKCPYCTAIFKIKSALEWHLQSKHADRPKLSIEQIADINIETVSAASIENICNSNGYRKDISSKKRLQKKQKQLQEQQQMQSPLDLSKAQLQAASDASGKSVDNKSNNNNNINNSNTSSNHIFSAASNHEKYYHNYSFAAYFQDQQQHQQHHIDNNIGAVHLETNECRTSATSPTKSIFSTCSSSSLTSSSAVILSTSTISSPAASPNQIGSVISTSSASSPAECKQNRRYRTQMSQSQIRILKALYRDIKTPSMHDCQNIGREIGLQKRVIKVWFQNARAKDKKSRHQRYLSDDSNCDEKTPESVAQGSKTYELRDCKLCHLKQVNIHQHAFTAEHIGRVKTLLEQTKLIKSQNKYTNGATNVTKVNEVDNEQTQEQHLTKSQQQQLNFKCRNENMAATQHTVQDFAALELLRQQELNAKVSKELNDLLDVNNALHTFKNFHPHVDADRDAASNMMENNLMLKINADNPLGAADVTAVAHPTDILQQLFNCNQMSGKYYTMVQHRVLNLHAPKHGPKHVVLCLI